MEAKKILLITMLVLTCGCVMFHPAPPLKESEIPYRLKAGIYTDYKGITHIVADEFPRWSVSEAYLYDSISRLNAGTPGPSSTSIWTHILAFLGGLASIWIFKKT